MNVTDFNLWDSSNLVPIIEVNGDPDFNLWDNLVPVCDVGGIAGTPVVTKRRIVFIF